MFNNIIRKGSVCGIAILFFILSVSPTISTLIDMENDNPNRISFMQDDYVNAFWKLDTGNGNTAYDSSGHDYDGTIFGASWTTGYSSNALDFDGQDDYVDFDDYAEDVLGFNKTDDLIFSFYIKSSSDGIIYSVSQASSYNPGINISLNPNGTIGFRIWRLGCGIYLTSENSYDDGEWHFVEIIYNGISANPTITMYVDGDFDNEITKYVCDFDAGDFNKARMGRPTFISQDYFDGIIDEFKMIKYPGGNQQNPPEISGPTTGEVGITYYFTFVTNDPEEDDIWLYIDWDDESSSEWIGPYESGEEVSIGHKFDHKGRFDIKAKSKDVWHSSEWSSSHVFRIGNQGPDTPTIDGPEYMDIRGSEALRYDCTFTDDFEEDLEWSVINNCVAGGWERGIPAGDGSYGDPTEDFDGSGNCYLTQNQPGNSDVDNGYTYLISPVFDLSGYDSARIDFACWYTNNFGSSPNRDYFRIYVSDNDGDDWTLAKTIGRITPQPVQWYEYSIDIDKYVSLTDQVRIQFEASDVGWGSTVEAGIDAVSIYIFESYSVDEEFIVQAEDFEGDEVFYWIDWDDGNIDEWIGPYDSGEEVILNHYWDDYGTYDIKVKAKDITQIESDLTNFIVRVGNRAPDSPVISGPSQGKYGEELTFKFSAEDYDGDNVWLTIDWGDGDMIEDFGPYEPGVEIEFKHTWEEEEKYIIEAWARDDLGGFSGKTTFPLKVVKAKSNLNYLEQISWIFVLFPKAFPILKYII